MPDIVLTTLNAKYIHAAFGLRYLLANLGPLQSRACLVEFDIHRRPVDIAEALFAQNPAIIGIGVYIWNVAPATEVVAILKRLRPDITIILGGPEVSFEVEDQPITALADHVITGEADLAFAEVCQTLLARGAAQVPPTGCLPKIIAAAPPDCSQLTPPYDFYTDEDIRNRIIYVEASRGCPFTCEFCLSSLEIPVRPFPLPALLGQLQELLDRGVRRFKFVDRTFNLNLQVGKAILEFFRARHQPGLFLHFEMIPDRLPAELREVVAKFPAGALQFEIGIQTFNEEVAARIKRRQNYSRLEENFRFLRNETGVHLHADLIAGLPGETVASFAAGFDRLVSLHPHEIQVGILKRLRGTPIVRHDAEWGMIYSPIPPYEILENRVIDFATMQRLRRFARYWDLVGNSANFVETAPLLWHRPNCTSPLPDLPETTAAAIPPTVNPGPPSAFQSFMEFSEWLHARAGRTDGIALLRLMEFLFEYLTGTLHLDARQVATTLWRDYQRGGRYDKPAFLKDQLSQEEPLMLARKPVPALPKRQGRHLA